MVRFRIGLWLLCSIVPIALSVGKQPRGGDDNAPLVDQLLEHVGLGRGGCKQMTELARAALKPPTEALKELAKMKGENAERSLHRWAYRQVWRKLMPKPYSFDVVMKDVENLRTEPGVATHAALLPHESFASLFEAAPELFEHLITGGASKGCYTVRTQSGNVSE